MDNEICAKFIVNTYPNDTLDRWSWATMIVVGGSSLPLSDSIITYVDEETARKAGEKHLVEVLRDSITRALK